MSTKKPSRSIRASKSGGGHVSNAPSKVVNIVEHLAAKGLADSARCRRFSLLAALATRVGLDEARADFGDMAALYLRDIFAA